MRLPLMLLFMTLMPAFSYAQPAGNKTAEERILSTIFDEVEKTIIEEYYGKKNLPDDKKKKHNKDKHKGGPPAFVKENDLPSGLAKMESLPPGLQKHIRKHGTLPPGLQRDLPADLQNRLPPARKGTKRVIIDDDIVLIEEGTRAVLDILGDVLREE